MLKFTIFITLSPPPPPSSPRPESMNEFKTCITVIVDRPLPTPPKKKKKKKKAAPFKCLGSIEAR